MPAQRRRPSPIQQPEGWRGPPQLRWDLDCHRGQQQSRGQACWRSHRMASPRDATSRCRLSGAAEVGVHYIGRKRSIVSVAGFNSSSSSCSISSAVTEVAGLHGTARTPAPRRTYCTADGT
eukprot:363016-Chlamydomonas_euryale.AAC.5